MAWILLIIAGVFEMLGINFLNAYTHTRKTSAVIGLIGFFSLSFLALSMAMTQLPIVMFSALYLCLSHSE